MLMKKISLLLNLALAVTLLTGSAEAAEKPATKPYPLDTCIVSDEKLGADPSMKTFTFTHKDQEIKLCCKSCQKTFNKDTAKYLKKLATAAKPAAQADKK